MTCSVHLYFFWGCCLRVALIGILFANAACASPTESPPAPTHDAEADSDLDDDEDDASLLVCAQDVDCVGRFPDAPPCADVVCDGETAMCVQRSKSDGFPCQGVDRCVPEGICLQGECFATGTVTCDDFNGCTDDTCDSTLGCIFTPNNAPCEDGDGCTEGDTCSQSVCQPGAPKVCDDANECTVDTCDSSLATGCVFQVEPGKACDDGDACTLGESCAMNGECVGLQTLSCDDENACSEDTCDQVLGCTYTNKIAPCDDGDPCTIGDVCSALVCAGIVTDCDDADPCTIDLCDPQAGCSNTPHLGSCDDGNHCTDGDSCANGQCEGVTRDCDDMNDCTFDFCQPLTGCQHTPLNGASCEDGSLCTVLDVCSSEGVCQSGSAADCDDDDLCTTDSCDATLGCVHAANTLTCDDLNACTIDDRCGVDGCAGTPVVCDDANPCTDDQCTTASGCTSTPNEALCDDGDPCTSGDVCGAGNCTGSGLTCDDSNPCTVDVCALDGVCSYTSLETPCDNGDLCTEGDQCVAGVCQAGDVIECDDNNACTIDICDPDQGCVSSILPACLPAKAWFIVNEFDYEQAGDDTADFVELLVVGEQTVQLEDYVVELIDGSTGEPYASYDLTSAGEQLHPGDRLILGPEAMTSGLVNQGAVLTVPGDFLDNGGVNGNAIRVRRTNFDGSTSVVDSVSYEAAVLGASEGGTHVGFDDQFSQTMTSFARCPDGFDTDDNAVDFTSTTPSPGLENTCAEAQ